jgi:hypothetical protein
MENLIYILLGIAFFIFKVIQESSKQKQEANKKRPVNTPEPFSPHDEIDRREPSRQPTSSEPIRPFSEPRQEEKATNWEELRRILIEEEKKKEISKAPIKTVAVKPRTQSAEPVKREQSIESLKRKTVENNPYSEILSDPDSLKKAFVMSEILKRREV